MIDNIIAFLGLKMYFLKRSCCFLLLLSSLLSLSACHSITPYALDIQQGNLVDLTTLPQLAVGMSSAKVRYILGAPLLIDPFHANRWDYVYYTNLDGEEKEKKSLQVWFAQDKLIKITGDGVVWPALPVQNASASTASAVGVTDKNAQ